MADVDTLTEAQQLAGIQVGPPKNVKAQHIRNVVASINRRVDNEAAPGALIDANNLSDVANAATARVNLDVIQRVASAVAGNLVTLLGSGEIADAGITPAALLQVANNLSDLANAATARANLGGVQTAAEVSAAISAAGHLLASNNLSDVAAVVTARANLDAMQRVASVVTDNLVKQTAAGEVVDAGVAIDDTGTTTAELLTAAEVDSRIATGGADPNAVHVNVAGEIAGIAEKTSPVNADLVIIEDSADSNNKKKVQVGNLPGGGGGGDFVTVNVLHDISVDGTTKDVVTIPVALEESILLSVWGSGFDRGSKVGSNHVRFRSFYRSVSGNVISVGGSAVHVALNDDPATNGTEVQLLAVGTNVIIRVVTFGFGDVNWNIKYLLQRAQ